MKKYMLGGISLLCCISLTGCAVAPGGIPFFSAIAAVVLAAGLGAFAIYRIVQRQRLLKRHSSRFPKKMLVKADVLTGILLGLSIVLMFSAGYFFYQSTTLIVPEPDTPSHVDTVTTEPYASTPQLPWKTFPVDQPIESERYFVFSVAQEDFVDASIDGTEVINPSHIVNLYTAYLATQHLETSEPITITQDMLDLIPQGAVRCGYTADSKHYAKALVEAMLVADSSDAAYAIAVHIGRQMLASVERPPETIPAAEALQRFVKEMNTTAKENGLNNTVFANPDGSPSKKQTMTVNDMITMTRLLFRFDSILKYTATDQFAYSPNPYESQMWTNPNPLVRDGDPYYCPYALGMKMTEHAKGRYHLLSTFRSNGQTLIIGVLDGDNTEQMTIDALHLFNTTMGVY